jgi:hypothetical protein
MSSAENNPGNFANRPTEEVKAIASKGGKASGEARSSDDSGSGNSGSGNSASSGEGTGRREDGTFLPGSEAAKEAGHKGGEARK